MFFVATVHYTVVLGAGLRVTKNEKCRTYLLQWNQWIITKLQNIVQH